MMTNSTLLLLSILFLIVTMSHGEVLTTNIVNYLQSEQVAVSAAQQSILQQLRQRRIPIGQIPTSLRHVDMDNDWAIEKRVIESRMDNHVDCRVTLDRAVVGSKCIAPCGCTGSSKWIQFSVLNKLRRKDPTQWILCQTCRQPFNYAVFTAYGGVSAALLSFVLDRPVVLRTALTSVLLVVAVLLNLPSWMSRFVVSSFFWSKYPQWSVIIKLPFALKLWLYKLVLVYLWEKYVKFEKDVLVSLLADWETLLIEDALPVPPHAGLEEAEEAEEVDDVDQEDDNVAE